MKVNRFLLPLLLFPSVVWADVYDLSVQGFVVRDEEPVTGTLECEFALYPEESGGEEIWSSGAQTISVDGGIFNAPLGDDSFPEPEDFPDAIYMEIVCDGEELTPRLQFSAVPMAMRAKYAERAGVADSIDEALVGSGLSAVSGGLQLNTGAANTWTGAQTFSSTVNVGGSVVVNSTTISPVEFSLLDGKDAALIDTNDTGVIGVTALSSLDSPTDEECLTYEADSGGRYEWQTCGGAGVDDDSLDFTKFEDILDLDANLAINQGAYTWTQTYTGTGTAMSVSATGGGVGVRGTTTSGTGVIGGTADNTGTGVYAYNSAAETGGTALHASGQISLIGGMKIKRTLVTTTPYTVSFNDYYIGVNVGGSQLVTINLPAVASSGCASSGSGRVYIINDEGGQAGAYPITIDGSGSETIDGSPTKVINTAYGEARIICDGSAWFSF